MTSGITTDLYFNAAQFKAFQLGREALALTHEAAGGGPIKVTADIDTIEIVKDQLSSHDRSFTRGYIVNILVRRTKVLAVDQPVVVDAAG